MGEAGVKLDRLKILTRALASVLEPFGGSPAWHGGILSLFHSPPREDGMPLGGAILASGEPELPFPQPWRRSIDHALRLTIC